MIIRHGDCIAEMSALLDEGVRVDAVVTDPPYELGFMGKGWDSTGIANRMETWLLAFELLKPGGHLLAFSGTRTQHRMVCAIEDAGFEIRDQIGWLYGTGFPKSLDVSKAIDKAAGAEREVVGNTAEFSGRTVGKGTSAGFHGDIVSGHCRDITAPATDTAKQWAGWGTALKPAWEPICVARKPLSEKTVAANVLEHGTGALNIDATRVPIGGDRHHEPTSRGGVRNSPADSMTCTSSSHGVCQRCRTGRSDSQVSPEAQRVSSTDLPANGSGHGTDCQLSPSSQAGYLTCLRCGGEHARGQEGRGQASSQQRSDAGIARGLHGECGHSREGLSMTCDDYTTPHVQRQGRWPSNLIHDGSEEVLEAFAAFGTSKSSAHVRHNGDFKSVSKGAETAHETRGVVDEGTAARFFYSAKASKADRAGSKHPTVKPISLMRYLCRLVTPPGGTILDPFAGSGTTLEAAALEGFRCIGIEQDATYVADIRRRLERTRADLGLFATAAE